MIKLATIVMTSALTVFAATPSDAIPAQDGLSQSSLLIQIADGCGGGRYRGPGGACHPFGRGPFPGGYYDGRNGCPPGHWRGPYGHCRDTPFHGRLPNGGWR
jgi:hypothetical protein